MAGGIVVLDIVVVEARAAHIVEVLLDQVVVCWANIGGGAVLKGWWFPEDGISDAALHDRTAIIGKGIRAGCSG